MAGQISSQEARRRVAQLSNFADGLWDMLLGGVFVLLSVYPVTRNLVGPTVNLVLFCGLLAALIATWSYARRKLSVPRVGIAKLSRGPLTMAVWITLFVVTVTLVLATLFMTNTVEQPAIAGAPTRLSQLSGDIFFTALIIGFFTVFAYVVGVPRLYFYGWLIALGNLASTVLMLYAGLTFGLPLALGGLIIVAVGASLFRRFVRRYPVPTQDD